MICSKCQGRGKYTIGPQGHDLRDCSMCGGTGSLLKQGLPKPPYPTLDAMLSHFDVVNRNLQDQSTKLIREAMRRGVRVIADHRIHSGEITLLVSPADFARIKQENNDGT